MGDFSAAIASLQKAVAGSLDQDDLGRLAQIHSASVAVAEASPACATLATRLARFVEALILGEARDPAAIEIVPLAVELLVRGGDADPAAVVLGDRLHAATGRGSSPDQTDYISQPLRIDPDEVEHLQGFIDESREHLDAIVAALLEVERDPGDTGKINELFRPFHTIKGIAGFLNLRDISRLTHEVEAIIDLGRRGEMVLTPEVIDVVFASIDTLKTQINNLAAHLATPGDGLVLQPDIAAIVRRLKQVQARACPTEPGDEAFTVEAATAARGGATGTGRGSSGSDEEAHAGESHGGESHGGDGAIRVDTSKLDAMVDAVGELVIAQTMVNLNQYVRDDARLQRDVGHVAKIVREVQERALAMRMAPIGPTFQKMRRVVRDVARKSGKLAVLRLSGEETELDKNVIQAIGDPLVHMVRNAVDHGLESPAQRRAAGKDEQGTVTLHARHQGGAIVIEISDDGRGLDPEALVAKGRERGIVRPGRTLTHEEAFALVFEPGFSTAARVTEISGRGVGLDVAASNIEALHGKIEIRSQVGTGSTFRIRLPLTLAIIDGMLVRVGDQRLVIPTVLIEHSLRPAAGAVVSVQRRGELLQFRGELLPLLRLAELFGYRSHAPSAAPLVVVVQAEGGKIGLVVDELIGQQQVVIKSLGACFRGVRGVSGAAVLGDGRVGLILEPTGLLRLHNERGGRGGRPRAEPTTQARRLETGATEGLAEAVNERS